MKSNKLVLIISTMLLSCLVIGSTFAWWVVTQKQKGNNIFNTACLNVTYENESGTVSLNNAYPITDIEGQKQQGYSFTIKNKCNDKVAYIVNLDVFNQANAINLQENEVNLGFDNRVGRTLNNYESADKHAKDASYAKKIYSGVLAPNGEATHTIKMWVDVNTGNNAQNANFKSQIFVTAGQNIEGVEIASDNCFITQDEWILKYNNYLCGDKVIVPQYINGVEMTSIYRNAFTDASVIMHLDFDNDNTAFYVLDEEHFDNISTYLNLNYESGSLWTSNYSIEKASQVNDWSFVNMDTLFSTIIYLQVPSTSEAYESGYANWQEADITLTFGWDGLGNLWEPHINYIDISKLKNLKEIHHNSIIDNDNLNTVELPEGLEKLSYQVFMDSALTQIFLPTTLKTIGQSCFDNNKLKKVEFNSNIVLEYSAFSNNDITYLEINDTITIGQNVFRKNPNLTIDDINIGYFSSNTLADFTNSMSDE